MYCITCEENADLISDFHIHYIGYYETDFEYCDGPFTFCPPPPNLNDDEWEYLFAQEPSLQGENDVDFELP